MQYAGNFKHLRRRHHHHSTRLASLADVEGAYAHSGKSCPLPPQVNVSESKHSMHVANSLKPKKEERPRYIDLVTEHVARTKTACGI